MVAPLVIGIIFLYEEVISNSERKKVLSLTSYLKSCY